MPKAKLTKSFVDQVPCTDKGQKLFADSELPGFYLIVGMRAKTYAVQKDIRGKSIRYTIGRHGHFTPEEARRLAREKLYMMAQGINPNQIEKQNPEQAVTVRVALENYLITRKSLKPRTREDYRYYIQRYLTGWQDCLMTDITKAMVLTRHAQLAEEHGKYTANKVMWILRALFNHVNASYDICPLNPVSHLSRVKAWFKMRRRNRYIKPHQLKAWWDAVHQLENDTYRDFFLLLLFTGLRRGEASRLRWADVDFKDRTFVLPDTKNGDALVLPMSAFIHDLFMRRFEKYGSGEFVFPGPGREGYLAEPKKGIYKVIELSGVEFFCHDLRRTFATITESLEVSAYAVKRLLNHRMTDDVTAGYIVHNVDRLREPVERVARYILDSVA